MSQAQLARLLGTSKGIISRYESGELGLRYDVQLKIFRALDISPGAFFEDPNSPGPEALIRALAEATSPEKRQRALDALK